MASWPATAPILPLLVVLWCAIFSGAGASPTISNVQLLDASSSALPLTPGVFDEQTLHYEAIVPSSEYGARSHDPLDVRVGVVEAPGGNASSSTPLFTIIVRHTLPNGTVLSLWSELDVNRTMLPTSVSVGPADVTSLGRHTLTVSILNASNSRVSSLYTLTVLKSPRIHRVNATLVVVKFTPPLQSGSQDGWTARALSHFAELLQVPTSRLYVEVPDFTALRITLLPPPPLPGDAAVVTSALSPWLLSDQLASLQASDSAALAMPLSLIDSVPIPDIVRVSVHIPSVGVRSVPPGSLSRARLCTDLSQAFAGLLNIPSQWVSPLALVPAASYAVSYNVTVHGGLVAVIAVRTGVSLSSTALSAGNLTQVLTSLLQASNFSTTNVLSVVGLPALDRMAATQSPVHLAGALEVLQTSSQCSVSNSTGNPDLAPCTAVPPWTVDGIFHNVTMTLCANGRWEVKCPLTDAPTNTLLSLTDPTVLRRWAVCSPLPRHHLCASPGRIHGLCLTDVVSGQVACDCVPGRNGSQCATELTAVVPGSLRHVSGPLPTSVSPLTLQGTAGGETIQMDMATTGGALTAINVTAGPLLLNPVQFTFPLVPSQTNVSSVVCRVSPGFGANLTVVVEFVDARVPVSSIVQAMRGRTYAWSAASTDRLSFAAPVIVTGSLRLTGQTAAGNASGAHIVLPSAFGGTIEFTATNVPVTSSADVEWTVQPQTVSIALGSVSDSQSIACSDVDVVAAGAAGNVTCSVPPGQGTLYRITLTVGTAAATSLDTVSYPAAPQVVRAMGCSGNDGDMTAECPTSGHTPSGSQLLLTVLGKGFSANTQFLVGTSVCPGARVDIDSANTITSTVTRAGAAASVYNLTQATCQLPEGTGTSVSVSAITDNKISRPVPLVSYARPTVDALSSSTVVAGAASSASAAELSLSSSCTQSTPIALVNCPRNGSRFVTTLTIAGQNFGSSGASVFVGSLQCVDVKHVEMSPHDKLTCVLPSSTKEKLTVRVSQLNGLVSEDSRATLSYQPCQPGTFQSVDSSGAVVGCEECPPGRFSRAAGQPLCLACEPGSYASAPGSSSCTSCPPRTTQPLANASACVECGLGRFSASEGDSSGCVPCGRGLFQNQTGQSGCLPCPVGTSSSEAGRSSCIACTFPTFQRSSGRVECDRCKDVTEYAVFENNNTLFKECASCPDNTDCFPDGAVLSQTGYYVVRDIETGLVVALECRPGLCEEGNRCQAGRLQFAENPLCGQCEPDLYEWGGKCRECESFNWPFIIALAILSFLFILVYHFISQKTNGETRVFLYFIQNAWLFVNNPEEWFSWLDVFNFSFLEAGGDRCVGPVNSNYQMLLGLLGPVITTAELLALLVLAYVVLAVSRCLRCLYSCCDPVQKEESMRSLGRLPSVREVKEPNSSPLRKGRPRGNSVDHSASGQSEDSGDEVKNQFKIQIQQPPHAMRRKLQAQAAANGPPSPVTPPTPATPATPGSTPGPGFPRRVYTEYKVRTQKKRQAKLARSVGPVDRNARPNSARDRHKYLATPQGNSAPPTPDGVVNALNYSDDDSTPMPDTASVASSVSTTPHRTPRTHVSKPIHRSESWASDVFGLDLRPFGRTLIGLYLFSYNRVTLNMFQVLNCVDVAEGQRVVRAFPAVSCDSDFARRSRNAMLALLLLWIAGIPLYLFYLLYRKKRRDELRLLDKTRVIGILSDVYRSDVYWWSLYSITRRTVLVFVVVFVTPTTTGNSERMAVLSLFNLLFLMVHAHINPFVLYRDNFMEFISLSALTVLTISLTSMSRPYDNSENLIIGLLVFGVGLLLVGYLLSSKMERFSPSWRKFVDNFLPGPPLDEEHAIPEHVPSADASGRRLSLARQNSQRIKFTDKGRVITVKRNAEPASVVADPPAARPVNGGGWAPRSASVDQKYQEPGDAAAADVVMELPAMSRRSSAVSNASPSSRSRRRSRKSVGKAGRAASSKPPSQLVRGDPRARSLTTPQSGGFAGGRRSLADDTPSINPDLAEFDISDDEDEDDLRSRLSQAYLVAAHERPSGVPGARGGDIVSSSSVYPR